MRRLPDIVAGANLHLMAGDRRRGGHSQAGAYLTAVLGPVALGAVLYAFRGHVAAANLALVFVVAIVALAAGTGVRGVAAVAAVSSALSFDFFCTRPYLSFRITSSSDLTTELLLLAVGLAVGELAARGRQARRRAEAGTDRLERVHGLGERIAAGEDPQFVVMAVAHELRDALSLRDCEFTTQPINDAGARIEADGSVTIVGRPWSADKLGLPTRKVVLPVRGRGRVLGSFVLTPTPARPVERDSCLLAVALADQLGAILAGRRLTG